MRIRASSCAFVNKNPLLQKYCTPEQKLFLEKHSICSYYKKGQVIFSETQQAREIFIICSGKVTKWKKGIHTHNLIIQFAKDGDILGYRGCLENSCYHLSANALADSQICSIDKEPFFKVMEDNLELHFNILLAYTRDLHNEETRLRNMAEMNVREKVAEALLTIQNTFGAMKNEQTLNIELSREELASVAGISTDRVIKQLSEFRTEKLLTIKGKKITLLQPAQIIGIVGAYHERCC